MRIVFMGTPEFALPTLKIIQCNNYDVVGVITAPDKYGGRGKKQLIQSAIKKYSVAEGLTVLQPRNLKSPKFQKKLKALNADLQVVVAFRMLPEAVWSMPPMGTLNLHGSLLPEFRGAAPIYWAIRNGKTKTGLTTFFLKHAIDTGNMLEQIETKIDPDETAGELHDRLMEIGAGLVLTTLQNISTNLTKPIEQDESKVSHARKISFDDGELKMNMGATEFYNAYRAATPYPGAWIKLNGKVFKIKQLDKPIKTNPGTPTGIHSDGKRFLSFSFDQLTFNVSEIQAEGKRKMKIIDFLNGNDILQLPEVTKADSSFYGEV